MYDKTFEDEVKTLLHIGEGDTFTSTIGMTRDDQAVWRIAVKGKDESIEWQKVYRQIAEQLLESIPALQAAGIK